MTSAQPTDALTTFIGAFRQDVVNGWATAHKAAPSTHRAAAGFLAALPRSLYTDSVLALAAKVIGAAPSLFSDSVLQEAATALPAVPSTELTDADRALSGGFLAMQRGDVILHLARRPRAKVMQAISKLESAGLLERIETPIGRRYRLCGNAPELANTLARYMSLHATGAAATRMAESASDRGAMYASRRLFEDATGLLAIPRRLRRVSSNVVAAQYGFDPVINGEIQSFPFQQYDGVRNERSFQVLLSSHVSSLRRLIDTHDFSSRPELLDQLTEDVDAFWLSRPAAISANGDHFIWVPVAPHDDFRGLLGRLPATDWGYQPALPGQNGHGYYTLKGSTASVDIIDVVQAMGYTISAEALALAERYAGRSHSRWNREYSQAVSSETVYSGLAFDLMPHQAAAADFIVANPATLLAMDTGTGKTPTPLAAAEHLQAYPLVVITTSAMKLLFAQEVTKFLPNREVIALGVKDTKSRKRIEAAGLESADVIVLNYEIVGNYLDDLVAREPQMLLCDESHYVKEETAKRTEAVDQLVRAAKIPRRVLASATPMKNRPEELVSQLRILGVIDQFGGPDGFRERYCGPTEVKVPFRNKRTGHVTLSKIRQFKGATNLDELHMMLRSVCMVRCDKRQVLKNLPPKSRSTLPLMLTGVRSYQATLKAATQAARERREVRRRLGIDISDGSVVSADTFDAYRKSGAAELTRIGELREAVGKGKLSGICQYIDDFTAGSNERLVVFAIHKSVQQGIRDHLEAKGVRFGTILDTDSSTNRLDTVNAFQSDDGPHVLLCSFDAAQEGLTLTAAHAALMCEYDWSPYNHIQAEDRLWRISQMNAVSALYAHAPYTIDDQMRDLILTKLDDIDQVLNARGDRDVGFFEEGPSEAQCRGEASLIRHLLAPRPRAPSVQAA